MRFYTYIWLRYDGSPYYIGKGQGRRGFISGSHRLHRPSSDDRILIQEFSTERDAHFAECFLINYFGRIDLGTGCLRNLTDGGEGVSGRVVPEWLRLRLIEVNTGRKASQKTRKLQSERHLGIKMSHETRKRMGAAKKGKPLSIEHKQKLSKHAKNRSVSHINKLAKAISKAMKGRPWSEKRRAAQVAR